MKYLDKWENLQGTEKMYLQVSDQFKSSMKLNQYKQFNSCKSLHFKKHLRISFD